MTPTPADEAYDAVVRVGEAISLAMLAADHAERCLDACGREDTARAMFALRGAMEGFHADVAGIVGEWGREP